MPDSTGLGEEALNKAAEIGLSSQLDEVENLNVDIKTDPLKLVQGQVDTVKIYGEGLVMQEDLRVEKMKMQVNRVAINPLSAAFGNIELTKPTSGSAWVILTESDINRAFNSEFIISKIQSQKIHINGQLKTVKPQQIDFRLLSEDKISLNAKILLVENSETYQISFTAIPRVSTNGTTIILENVNYSEGKEISPELTKALVEQTSEILNLSNFDLEGMSLRVKQLQVETGKLTLQAEAYVEQIPSAKN
ncbi:LmeA family phospholipid-binding protein [Anabaena subtropica]|uniref:DUF2993 domain-containing protein n=1 Tax=Anabaena subtropica FACHB-260 TaxID=2692884 RepID=A0ABR8CTN0_9NOST|nr:DUF2993 domain-containing protein [Anabaena subtropica]MBD2346551.1 DUF2993 domain-containing protein [Anabaena subtropica FACHB-260]